MRSAWQESGLINNLELALIRVLYLNCLPTLNETLYYMLHAPPWLVHVRYCGRFSTNHYLLICFFHQRGNE